MELHRSALRHGGGLLLPGRHPDRPAPAVRRRLVELARPAGAALGRPRRDLAGERRRRRSGSPRAAAPASSGSGSSRPGSTPRRCGPAPSRARSGGRPTAASTFALEQQLWDHPHRAEWGAGFGGQAFHTILPHPDDPDSVTVAISTGGVYQTADGGDSWEPRNQGIRAEFLPEGQQYPEFGQCVHKVTRHPSRPERLYLQNHGGVYRSDDHARIVGLHRRRAARRLRVPGRGPPARAGHDLRVPEQQRRRPLPAGRPRRGSGARATPARPGRSSATGCPTSSSSA